MAGYSRIVELEAYTPSTPSSGFNVALVTNGGVPTASSTSSVNYPSTAINNGDRKGLNWGAGGGWNDATFNTYPDWVQIDFDGSKAINEIDVFTIQDNWSTPTTPTLSMQFSQYGITDFEVQYWTGSTWADVPGGNVTGNRNVWRQFTFPSVTTNKIRVQVNNAMGASRIVEIEAYQTPGTGTPPPTPSPTPSTGVWIAPRTDGQDGTGTNADPYNGSTAAGITIAINNKIGANTVVHFAAGNYSVSNITPKAGMKILGAGKDVTTFLWNGEQQWAMISAFGGGDAAEVRDLTLNLQQDVYGTTPMAINIYDSNNVIIHNVRVTNFKAGPSEGFPLIIFCGAKSVTGALIEYCEMDHCYRGTAPDSPFSATLLGFGYGGGNDVSISGVVQYNYIHDCPKVQGLAGGGTNSVFQGNVVVGTEKAWYRDSFFASNTQVINNHFLNCSDYGIAAASDANGTDDPINGCDGLIVANNIVTMDPTSSWGIVGVLLRGSYVTNAQVYGNTVGKVNATGIQYGLKITSPGTAVHDNSVSPGFINVPQ
jgi:hypothetical protein